MTEKDFQAKICDDKEALIGEARKHYNAALDVANKDNIITYSEVRQAYAITLEKIDVPKAVRRKISKGFDKIVQEQDRIFQELAKSLGIEFPKAKDILKSTNITMEDAQNLFEGSFPVVMRKEASNREACGQKL